MIKCILDGFKIVKDLQGLIAEVDTHCQNTVKTVRANGVVLEEFKNNNYVSRKKNS